MNEGDLIFVVFEIPAVLAIIVYAVTLSLNRIQESDDERTRELLRKTRTMFPSAENDIFALDALHQHIFRELLMTQEKNTSEWETLKHDSILIWNAKNKAIIEAVRYEERYIGVLSKAQGTFHRSSHNE